jgi:hypothetical protein
VFHHAQKRTAHNDDHSGAVTLLEHTDAVGNIVRHNDAGVDTYIRPTQSKQRQAIVAPARGC